VQIGALAAFGAVLAMVLAAALRPVDRVLSSRALTGAGLRSYSFYLLHSILGGMALNAASKHLPTTVLGDVARLAIALLASSLAAYALWRLVEVPAQRLARRVALSPRSTGDQR
jgi:peptidoglycan/LPS O-acetylase OafA/YrhL